MEPRLLTRLPAFFALAQLTAGLGMRPAKAQEPVPWLEEAEEPELLNLGDDSEPWAWCYKKSLENGEQLPYNPRIYKRWHADKAWGTADLIEVLTTESEEMAWLLPQADPVVIGDISTRNGGRLDGHKSHRGGVDADVGLYWGEGQMFMQGFRNVSPKDLDASANWLLIRSMLDTGRVERILLDQALVRVLRDHVIQSGELSREEAWRIFPATGDGEMWRQQGVVHHVAGHRHHMHVRVFCPER